MVQLIQNHKLGMPCVINVLFMVLTYYLDIQILELKDMNHTFVENILLKNMVEKLKDTGKKLEWVQTKIYENYRKNLKNGKSCF